MKKIIFNKRKISIKRKYHFFEQKKFLWNLDFSNINNFSEINGIEMFFFKLYWDVFSASFIIRRSYEEIFSKKKQFAKIGE